MDILPLALKELRYQPGPDLLIEDITAAFAPGPISVIMGHNGAGKSLLLKLCHGLIAPSAGTIDWNGVPEDQARLEQAMVFQKPVMLRRSVAANIDYPLKLRKLPAGTRKTRVEQALTDAGLTRLADRYAPLLSGGEQQKLALARAWALKPQVMLLDEPTASLDPAATKDVEQLIRAIHGAGTKVIMTSHLIGQVKRLADEVLFLHAGRLVETGPAAKLLARPKSAQARAYLAGELPD
jgi:tungstate transport system ATP-binding protein